MRTRKDIRAEISAKIELIEAKKTYSSRNPKHKTDLETISKVLDGLF